MGRTGGRGPGLAEVADFAADHGGTLRVTPRPDAAGVRVELRLLAAAGTGPHPGEVVPPPADADGALAGILEGIARWAPLAEPGGPGRHHGAAPAGQPLLDPGAGPGHPNPAPRGRARLPAAYRAAIA